MLIKLQNIILKMVAQGDELELTLDTLCLELEQLLPRTRASILTLDRGGQLHPCAGPSLPDNYSSALENLRIGPTVGSCGSAAYHQEVVIVENIENDYRWGPFKALALPLGLKACFSSPIFGSKGEVLGTIALYFDEARRPTAFEQSVVEGCLPLCLIALERHERVLERERLAFTDVLTDLPNRARFNKDLKTLATDRWSLLLIDIDNLKTVNDTFGHAAGDDLISIVASRIADAAVPWRAYRIGGDEFAVILERTPLTHAAELAGGIIGAVSKPAICGRHTAFPTITTGIAESAHNRTTAEV